MKKESGLKFARCDSAEFRSFVKTEWENTLKRAFGDGNFPVEYHLRPPKTAFSRMSRLRGQDFHYTLKKLADTPFSIRI